MYYCNESKVERYIRMTEEYVSILNIEPDHCDSILYELDGLWWSLTPEERREVDLYVSEMR